LKEASSLLKDDEGLLSDMGGDLLSELDALTSEISSDKKKKAGPPLPPAPSGVGVSTSDDLFDMLGSNGTDVSANVGADFDFDSYISNADAGNSGGLFS
jgi:hypothetical protein